VSSVAVADAAAPLRESARALARELDLPWFDADAPGDCRALLLVTASGLCLQPCGPGASGPVQVDFGAAQMRHRRRGGHNEPLGRAVGVGKWPRLRVVDATAGLGRDSFVLADLGCEVLMLERSPIAFALLRDGLLRASCSEDDWLREVSARLSLQHADSLQALRHYPGDAPEVVYLDPMFPERKKSARVKKEMWLFQHLVEGEDNAGELLEQALRLASRRVVVKRPSRAPALAGQQPHYELAGKTVRFDVYNCG